MLSCPLISNILCLVLLNEVSQEPTKYTVKNIQLSVQEWDHLYLKHTRTKVRRGDSQGSIGMLCPQECRAGSSRCPWTWPTLFCSPGSTAWPLVAHPSSQTCRSLPCIQHHNHQHFSEHAVDTDVCAITGVLSSLAFPSVFQAPTSYTSFVIQHAFVVHSERFHYDIFINVYHVFCSYWHPYINLPCLSVHAFLPVYFLFLKSLPFIVNLLSNIRF